MLETTVRDTDAPGILPVLIPTILELLRLRPPCMEKNNLETQFRRQILDIIHKLPFHESVRNHVMSIFTCMVHILKTDNEDMGVTSCKVIQDTMRVYKSYTEETMLQVLAAKSDIFQSVQSVVDEYLSDDSPLVSQDQWFPSSRSFKVLNELSGLSAIIVKNYRTLLPESLEKFGAAMEVVNIEVPAQAVARAEARSQGTVWAGMAPSVKNVTLYTELITAQIKASQ
jgi:transformation/transcription domain-associated protein